MNIADQENSQHDSIRQVILYKKKKDPKKKQYKEAVFTYVYVCV